MQSLTFAELYNQPIDVDELSLRIRERQHFYIVEVLGSIVDCFEKEDVPISKFLDALVTIVGRKDDEQNHKLTKCVKLLEEATSAAEVAEADRAAAP